MDPLNSFLGLISKTQGRDKFLRVIQYLTIHALDHPQSMTHNIYIQMRMTRKILRFLRTLQYSTKVKTQAKTLPQNYSVALVASILMNLSMFLYYLSDHRVCLSELGVISPEQRVNHYPRSMIFYGVANLMGVIKNIALLTKVCYQAKSVEDKTDHTKKVKELAFDLVRSLLDIIVAAFYYRWEKKPSLIAPSAIGLIGIVTSIMSILQSLKMM